MIIFKTNQYHNRKINLQRMNNLEIVLEFELNSKRSQRTWKLFTIPSPILANSIVVQLKQLLNNQQVFCFYSLSFFLWK